MDIVSRARNIIVRPGREWAVIDAEPSSVGNLYTTYLVPLGLIGPIASFIGLTVIGVSIPFLGTYRAPFLNGVSSAAISFVAVLIGVYIWALIINALAPTFSGQKNQLAALKVAVFAATPALLAGILSLLPMLGVLQLVAALYGLYLLYLGLPVLMKSPREKALGYTAVTILSGIVIGIIFGVLMAALHFTPVFGGTPQAFGGLGRPSDEAVAQNVIAGAIGAAGGGTDDSKTAGATIAAGVVAAAQNAAAASESSAAPATQVHAPGADADANTDADGDAKKGAAAAVAGIAAIGALVGGGKAHVETVSFRSLKELLPSAVGPLARTDARGEKNNTAGLGVSMAEGTYGGSTGGQLTLKISDMGNASGIMAIGKLALNAESESDSGYEKNVTIGGRKIHEKWTAAGKTSELTTFVGDRFLIEVNGSGLDMPLAEEAIKSVDVDRVAALKS